MKTLYYILYLSAIVAVFLLWMTNDAQAGEVPEMEWYLFLTYTVKDTPTTCGGEVFPDDRVISRAGWIMASHKFEPFVPSLPMTLRRLDPGDVEIVPVRVRNSLWHFYVHTQSLVEDVDGSRRWVVDAECDTFPCFIWMGHANCYSPDGKITLFHRLVPVEGGE